MEGQEVQQYIVNPASGELVARDAPTNDLGAQLDAVRELEGRLRTFKRAVSDEILGRMDKEGLYTYRLGGFKITGKAPPGPKYDGEVLHRELTRLVEQDVITPQARDRAVSIATVYEPHAAGIKALAKLEACAPAIKAAALPNNDARNVSVSKEMTE